MGVARIFQRGGHTESYRGDSPDCHLNILGCLLTKRLTKGGSRAPQSPLARPLNYATVYHMCKDVILEGAQGMIVESKL